MNTSAIIVAVFPVLLIVGALLAPLLARRERSAGSLRRPRSQHESREPAQHGDWQKIHEMDPSRLPTEAAGDSPPAMGDQYFADWTALQAKFID